MSNGVKEHREAYNCNILIGGERVLRATPQRIARHMNCIKKSQIHLNHHRSILHNHN